MLYVVCVYCFFTFLALAFDDKQVQDLLDEGTRHVVSDVFLWIDLIFMIGFSCEIGLKIYATGALSLREGHPLLARTLLASRCDPMARQLTRWRAFGPPGRSYVRDALNVIDIIIVGVSLILTVLPPPARPHGGKLCRVLVSYG